MHTLCTISEQPLLAETSTYPRPKSITHLRTFSDNGVYVALQLFLVILVSDQWRRVLIPYSYRQAPWGLLHARGWLSRYTWDQRLYMVSEPRETHSLMLKARFLHLTNLVAARDRTPDLLTTRPTCYYSAMALCWNWFKTPLKRPSHSAEKEKAWTSNVTEERFFYRKTCQDALYF